MRSSSLTAILLASFMLVSIMAALFLFRGVDQTVPLDCLPRDTEAVLHAPDLPRLLAGFSQQIRLSGSSGESGRDLIADMAQRALRRQGISTTFSAEMAASIPGEVILALIPGGASEQAGLALIVTVGHGSEGTAEVAKRLAGERLGAQGTGVGHRKHHGRNYLVLRPPGSTAPICVGGLRGVAIMTTSAASMRKILDTIEGRTESLRSDPLYRKVRQHLGRRADLLGYSSGAWLREVIAARLLSGDSRRVTKLMGLEALRGAGLAIQLREDLFQERLFFALAPEMRGLPGELFRSPPQASRALRLLPAGFPYYLALSFSDLGAAYGRLPGILSGATGADREDLRQRLSGLEDFLALDLRRDLISALGDQIAVGFGSSSVYPRGASNRALYNIPAVVSVFTRNRPAIEKILRRTDGLARAMGAYSSFGMDGQAMITYRFDSLAPLTPTYRLTEAHLLAATSPERLATALEADRSGTAVTDLQEAARRLEALPPKAHLIFLAQSERLIDLVDPDQAGPSLPLLVPESLPIALKLLAREGGLRITAGSGRLGEAGLILECVSPVSASLLAYLYLSRPPLSERTVQVDEVVTPAEPGAGLQVSVPF